MSNDNTPEKTDEEISEATGMGPMPSLDEGEETPSAEDAEDKSTKDDADEADEDDEQDDENDSADDSDSEDDDEDSDDDDSEDEEEDSDEDEDEEDSDEDDDDEEAGKGRKPRARQRTVPYSKLKDERSKRKNLEGEVGEIKTMLGKLLADKEGDDADDDAGDEQSPLKEAVAKLKEELGEDNDLDSVALEKLLETAVGLAKEEFKGQKIPKELKDKLPLLEEIEKGKRELEEDTHFTEEWNDVLPSLKKQYPNATEEMLEEAKDVMDELSHTKKHHKHDMDYILFKNPKKFKDILKVAPGNKGGEAGKQIGTKTEDDYDGEDETLVDMEDLTPDIMRKREGQDTSRRGKKSSADEHSDIQIMDPLE